MHIRRNEVLIIKRYLAIFGSPVLLFMLGACSAAPPQAFKGKIAIITVSDAATLEYEIKKSDDT